MDKHFINLTNGLEWMIDGSIPPSEANYMHISSTSLENKDYVKLLKDLDHNFLFNLAIGNTVYLYDCGANKEYSKVCYKGVPLLNYLLTRFWLGHHVPSLCYRYNRTGVTKIYDQEEEYKSIYDFIFERFATKQKKEIKVKLSKYKNKFLNNSLKEINIIPVSKSTNKDGNYPFYKNIIDSKL